MASEVGGKSLSSFSIKLLGDNPHKVIKNTSNWKEDPEVENNINWHLQVQNQTLKYEIQHLNAFLKNQGVNA